MRHLRSNIMKSTGRNREKSVRDAAHTRLLLLAIILTQGEEAPGIEVKVHFEHGPEVYAILIAQTRKIGLLDAIRSNYKVTP